MLNENYLPQKFNHPGESIAKILFLSFIFFLCNWPLKNSSGSEVRNEQEVHQPNIPPGKAEALKLYQKGNYEKAIEIWTEQLDSNPKDPSPANNIGIAYRKLGKPDKALGFFQRAIEISPDYAHAYYSLGLAYYDLKKYERAKEAFEESIRRNYKPAASHFNLGLSLYSLRDYSKAQEVLSKAIELKYDPGPSYYQLGLIKYQLNDHKGAAEALEEAIKYAHTSPGSHYYLGLCYLEMKKPNEAERAFKKEVKLKTKYSYEASKYNAKADKERLERQGKIIAIISIFGIPFLVLIYSRRNLDFQKILLFITFLLFLPLPFVLSVFPPALMGILFYPYVISAPTVIGMLTMLDEKTLAYFGFFFSSIYLIGMALLIYWFVSFLSRMTQNGKWLWGIMGLIIGMSFLRVYGAAILGRHSRTNWIEMIKAIFSGLVS